MVINKRTWVRNVSHECMRNKYNVNKAHPMKKIWVIKIYHECAKDGNNNYAISAGSDCYLHC